jgi:hypothetical protein
MLYESVLPYFEEMYRCLHFDNDWDVNDGNEWDDYYGNAKMNSPDNTAHH